MIMIILYHQLLRFFFFAACNDIFLINPMMLIVAVGHELGVENIDFGGRVIMELQVVLQL